MADGRRLWLITNPSSGSNEDDALQSLVAACDHHGFRVAQRTAFPAQELPDPAVLDAAGIDLVAVFSGDGTLNAAIGNLAGWSGEVLVLPGGTMNLLYHRLFGDLSLAQAVDAVAKGKARPRRPGIISGACGLAYAGLLAGPGTAWYDVREALRDNDLIDMAVDAREALAQSVSGSMIVCREPAFGRRSGYPLLLLDPHDDDIAISAYRAETAAEYLEQAWALVQRDFREGPHEDLGSAREYVLESADGEAFGVLLDGEPATAQGPAAFRLAQCEVDLLATVHDGR